jgi:hypothetical protein
MCPQREYTLSYFTTFLTWRANIALRNTPSRFRDPTTIITAILVEYHTPTPVSARLVGNTPNGSARRKSIAPVPPKSTTITTLFHWGTVSVCVVQSFVADSVSECTQIVIQIETQLKRSDWQAAYIPYAQLAVDNILWHTEMDHIDRIRVVDIQIIVLAQRG